MMALFSSMAPGDWIPISTHYFILFYLIIFRFVLFYFLTCIYTWAFRYKSLQGGRESIWNRHVCPWRWPDAYVTSHRSLFVTGRNYTAVVTVF